MHGGVRVTCRVHIPMLRVRVSAMLLHKKEMEVKKITKKLKLSTEDVVKYQILTEIMFFKKEYLISSDLEILTLLAVWGPTDLVSFCNNAAKSLYKDMLPEEIAVRSQNIRNRVVKLEKRKLVEKTNEGRKQIQIAKGFNIVSKGNILLDYNYLGIESSKA